MTDIDTLYVIQRQGEIAPSAHDTLYVVSAQEEGIKHLDGWSSLFNFVHEDGTILWEDYALMSSMVGVVSVLLILVLLWFLYSRYSQSIRDNISRLFDRKPLSLFRSLKFWFGIVWLFGFIVYDIGMCTGKAVSLLTNAPLAIVYAFKIFLFDSDVSEIHEMFHSSWVYSFLFALAHFAAAVISTLFVIKFVGFNFISKTRMFLHSVKWLKWAKNHSVTDTYVFWGFNDASYELIESIIEHYKKLSDEEKKEEEKKKNGDNKGQLSEEEKNGEEKGKDNDNKEDKSEKKSCRIIVIRTNTQDNKDDSPENMTAFHRIFNFLSLPSKEMKRLQHLEYCPTNENFVGCLTNGTFVSLSDINVTDEKKDIIGGILKMGSLKRLLSDTFTSSRIHMLFLSDDENANIHDVTLLRKDSTINDFACRENNPRKVLFYCRARYNSIHRVLEDRDVVDGIETRIIDSSHLSVEVLKRNPDLLPVRFVDIEKDASVSSAFNALVVGFSEVGQDATSFLYEFGAFAKKEEDGKIMRSDFTLHVVDKDMLEKAGAFAANAPSIKLSMHFKKGEVETINGDKKDNAQIALYKMDCQGVDFYEKLTHEWIRDLNYVIIATENDELNITLGVRILRAAVRYRKNTDKLCILVRTHNDEDHHIRGIAQYYNRLWAADIVAQEPEGNGLNQGRVGKNEIIGGPIHVFGLENEVFTYDNIIDNKILEEAKKYTLKYEETTNPDDVHSWNRRFHKLMQLKPVEDPTGKDKDYSKFSPTYSAIMKLRRQENQDIANSLHRQTKEILLEEALKKLKLDKSAFKNVSRELNTINYVWADSIGEEGKNSLNEILNILAHTEHFRWNASHEILGYIYAEKKSESALEHDCLISWEELLNDEKRSYDCNVVDYFLGVTMIHTKSEE